MSPYIRCFSLVLCLASFGSSFAQDDDNAKAACEAVLCLSSGTRPDECAPSLARYFSISFRRWSDTVRARQNFLNLCPIVGRDAAMSSLTRAISNGAGRCDAATLNSALQNGDETSSYISNELPDYCAAYVHNGYADINDKTPTYLGEPLRGGYWVERGQFAIEQRAYLARLNSQSSQ